MKDKRKEILRDLLGEFASDEDTENDSNDIFKSKMDEKEEKVGESPVESDESEFNLDKVMKRPSRRPKTVKKVSNVLKAEIV